MNRSLWLAPFVFLPMPSGVTGSTLMQIGLSCAVLDTPTVDKLGIEPPVASNFEPWQLATSQQLIDG
jgi:hypothetical protein